MACSSENHSQEAAQVNLKPRWGEDRPGLPPAPLAQGEKASNCRGVLPLLASRTSGAPGSAFGLWSAHVPWRVTAPQAGAGHARAAARGGYNPLVETGKPLCVPLREAYLGKRLIPSGKYSERNRAHFKATVLECRVLHK
jgi:hypothetical protein